MNFALCLSLLLVSGVTFATGMETKIIDAKDVLTTPLETKENLRYTALACTTSHSVCSRLAGEYGYEYYYAEIDYDRCHSSYPYACYGVE